MRSTAQQRYVALDLHKVFVMVGGVNDALDVILKPRRVLMAKLAGWVAKHLRPTDIVVIEAGTNTWYVHDLARFSSRSDEVDTSARREHTPDACAVWWLGSFVFGSTVKLSG